MTKKRINDIYTRLSKLYKLRSRAWFKLDEIQKNEKIIKSKNRILDLGSSPGGWSQYISTQIKKSKGYVIACDIVPMKSIEGVKFIQVDVCNLDLLHKSLNFTDKSKIHTVLSDMSPKICGVSEIDIPKSMELAEITLKICNKMLIKNGNLLVKVFQNKDLNKYLKKLNIFFKQIKVKKLKTSRIHSRELYIIAKGYKL